MLLRYQSQLAIIRKFLDQVGTNHYCAPKGASQRLGNWIDENVLYPWALAETCECEAFVVDCTAGFDMSELQGSRGVIMIFGSGPSLLNVASKDGHKSCQLVQCCWDSENPWKVRK